MRSRSVGASALTGPHCETMAASRTAHRAAVAGGDGGRVRRSRAAPGGRGRSGSGSASPSTRRIRRSQRRSSSSVSSAASTAEEVRERLRLERLVEHRGAPRGRGRPTAPSARTLGQQRLARVSARSGRTGGRWPGPRSTKRGLPPVDSCSSGIPSGASSLGESGSRRTIASGVETAQRVVGRRFGPLARGVTMRRREAGAAAAQVAESGDRLRRRPSAGRRCSSTSGPCSGPGPTRGLRAPRPRPNSALARGRVPSSGRTCASAGQPPDVELDAGERVAERGGERHVGQVALELGAARTPDADVVEPAPASSSSRRVFPSPASPSIWISASVPVEPAPDGARERLELGRPAEQAQPRVADRRPRLRGAIGRGSRTSDVLLAEDGRLERTRLGVGSSPSSSSSRTAEAAVAGERLVLTAERVERQHLAAPVRSLAEAVEGRGGLGVRERGAEVELGEGGVGGVERGRRGRGRDSCRAGREAQLA